MIELNEIKDMDYPEFCELLVEPLFKFREHYPESLKHNPYLLPKTTRDKINMFVNADITAHFMIKNDGENIGWCSLRNINHKNHSAELSIYLISPAQKQGVGLHVMQELFRIGFRNHGLNRIWTGTSITNEPMIKLAEKSGMKHEGIFRQGIFLEGSFFDIWIYGLLHDEWAKQHMKDCTCDDCKIKIKDD